MTIGERIKNARIDKGLNQTELAKLCGYANKGNISRIENSGNEVTTKQVKRIAEKLDVSVSYLMGYAPLGDDLVIEIEKMTPRDYKHLLEYARRLNSKDAASSGKTDGAQGEQQ